MRQFTHLQHYEREVIQKMMYSKEKYSLREIARKLGRSPSTILREIKRNATRGYNAREAGQKAEKRRKGAYQRKIDRIPELRERIEQLLAQHYSPELIAYMLKQEGKYQCSHETIYMWCYEQIHLHKRHDLVEKMFFKRKKRQNRRNVYKNRYAEIGKKRIPQRPEAANNRSEAGHFEGDLIESKNKDAYLLTLVDRMSAYSIALKLPLKDAETVTRAIIEVAEELPPKSIKTLTFDNGKEFSKFSTIEEVLGCEVYFADPYAAYQRGLNENINRQFRHFLPKNKSFAHVTDDDIAILCAMLNNRPRKSRNWKTPYELFYQQLNVAFQT